MRVVERFKLYKMVVLVVVSVGGRGRTMFVVHVALCDVVSCFFKMGEDGTTRTVAANRGTKAPFGSVIRSEKHSQKAIQSGTAALAVTNHCRDNAKGTDRQDWFSEVAKATTLRRRAMERACTALQDAVVGSSLSSTKRKIDY